MYMLERLVEMVAEVTVAVMHKSLVLQISEWCGMLAHPGIRYLLK